MLSYMNKESGAQKDDWQGVARAKKKNKSIVFQKPRKERVWRTEWSAVCQMLLRGQVKTEKHSLDLAAKTSLVTLVRASLVNRSTGSRLQRAGPK